MTATLIWGLTRLLPCWLGILACILACIDVPKGSLYPSLRLALPHADGAGLAEAAV